MPPKSAKGRREANEVAEFVRELYAGSGYASWTYSTFCEQFPVNPGQSLHGSLAREFWLPREAGHSFGSFPRPHL